MSPSTAEQPLTWLVGSHGLLGSAVGRLLERRADPYATVTVPWTQVDDAVATLLNAAEQTATAATAGTGWRIAWCAGAGVIGTSQAELDAEIEVLQGFFSGLATRIEAGLVVAPVAVFLASSAGGVYAGSSGVPYDEATAPVPISPYGHAKLAAEGVFTAFAERCGVPVVLGRIANLYGPGQDVSKPQGLVSQLCRAHLTRTPLSIYVPLDTARDYLYVDDAAAALLGVLERAAGERAGGDGAADGPARVKILATQRPTSLASILAELRRVTKRRPQVVLGTSPNARFQPRDLRFRSVVWPEVDDVIRTPLAAGVAATLESLGHDLRTGALPR